LSLSPVKVKDSLYLLIPKAIAELFDINAETTFHLSVEKNGDGLLLVFRTGKSAQKEVLK